MQRVTNNSTTNSTAAFSGMTRRVNDMNELVADMLKFTALGQRSRETLASRQRLKQEGARRFSDLHPQVGHVL